MLRVFSEDAILFQGVYSLALLQWNNYIFFSPFLSILLYIFTIVCFLMFAKPEVRWDPTQHYFRRNSFVGLQIMLKSPAHPQFRSRSQMVLQYIRLEVMLGVLFFAGFGDPTQTVYPRYYSSVTFTITVIPCPQSLFSCNFKTES